MRLFYSIMLLSIFYSSLISEECDDYRFMSQNQLDSFIKNNPNCDTLTREAWIEQHGGRKINSLLPLRNIKYIKGKLYIENAEELESLEGLENLEYIEGDLKVLDNPKLKNLDALFNLKGVGGEIVIDENDSLYSISGISNITSGISKIKITDNPLLRLCNLNNICDYLNSGRNIFIKRNGNGCTDNEEVKKECTQSSVENKSDKMISYKDGRISFAKYLIGKRVMIYNLFGSNVFNETLKSEVINISYLNHGIYFLIVDNKSFKIIID